MVTVLLLSLLGCSTNADPGIEIYSNEQFSVKEHNGERYLDFHDDSYQIAADAIGHGEALEEGSVVTFKSVKEMKECIEQGKFSKEDLVLVQTYAKASNGKVAVCDTKNLYDVKLPEDTILRMIGWFGTNYTFVADTDSTTTRIHLVSKEERDKYIASKDVEANSNLEIVSKEVDLDGTTTIVYDNLTFNYRSRIVRYTVTVNGNAVTFLEKYDYGRSETIPWGISFWGEGNGAYFYGTISGFEEVPSREWLTSFAVVPYVETVTE